MKQWNGLLKKEWLAMKGWFYGSIIAHLCVVLFLSFSSSFILEEASMMEMLLIFSGLLGVMFIIILPTTVLLGSLNKEMHRPDIWLHSTAPTAKLFGVKMLYASMIGFVNMLLPLMIVFIGSRFSEVLGFMFFLSSIFIMCTGLFLWVLYQLLKPVVKGFSGPIVVIIFLLLSWLQARLSEFTTNTKSFYLEFARMEIHTGKLLIDFALAVLFFIAAAVLFEKKVRI